MRSMIPRLEESRKACELQTIEVSGAVWEVAGLHAAEAKSLANIARSYLHSLKDLQGDDNVYWTVP